MRRRQEDRLIAGVAGGAADRLGLDDVYVRAGFLVLSLVWGAGIVLYLALWGVNFDRAGPQPPARAQQAGRNQRIAYALMFGGSLLALRAAGVWPGDQWVWPGAALIFSAAFLMDRREIDPRSAIIGLFDPASGRVRNRTVIGIVLLLIGAAMLIDTAVPYVQEVLLAALVTGVGMAVLFGPWVWRLAADLSAERSKRIRQEERDRVAAHLHDSVLQTLALIQRTDDPRRVATLARAQERDLRRWLYGPPASEGPELLSNALQKEADRIEDTFDFQVELVTVGDRPVDDRARALVAASGEALTNAALHSDAEQASVYSEATEETADVWISDLGKGFDAEQVAEDRRGIAESIVGRLAKKGGRAAVTSEPGEGTEVHLHLDWERP